MVSKEKGIRYFPIGLFTSVMGFSAVTIAVKQVETLYDLNYFVSTIFLVLSTLFFVLNGSMLMNRLIRCKEDVKADFDHPVKMNFFAAISISLLLLATAYIEISNQISFILWVMGALLQIILTLVILSKLVWKHEFQIMQFNPTWFIPIVGNIVVPIAGIAHVSLDINWLFFSIGVFFSIVYTTLFFIRVFFHSPLPNMLLPTYFILMAPPAIGFISYMKIVGNLDNFAYILYGIAFFIGLLLLFQIKKFFTIPFMITWWAYLFPSAAMTIATIQMYAQNGKVFYQGMIIVQVIGLIVLTVYLLWKTIRLAMKKSLCVKDS